jgi:thioredoxin 1
MCIFINAWIQTKVTCILTDANFDQAVAGSRLPLLVDFWAEWCMPCRSMAPVVEAMSRDHSGRAYFAKMNTDQNRVPQARFGVMSIPNFIFFKGGKQVDQVLGAVGRLGLETILSRYLS